jgi:hypothetical protein
MILTRTSQPAVFLRTTAVKKPRTEFCCQPVAFMITAIVVPLGCLSRARTASCLVPAWITGEGCSQVSWAFSCRSWRTPTWSLWGFCCATCSDPFRLRRHHRRHHRSPAMAASPAGQDRGLGQRPCLGTGDSDALFAAEVHPFLGGKLSAIRPNFLRHRVFTNASASLDSRVRILSGQPRSAVSWVIFPSWRELPAFPRVRLAGAGLWPAISGISVLWAKV